MNNFVRDPGCAMGWQEVFRDIDAVQIILYLRKYNPNINASTITKGLLMNEDKVIKILNDLICLDAVEYSRTSDTWKLTNRGRNVADCLVDLK